ncbi:hypothetical protein DsansV1_C08g0085431 [Dioscorea sansibarensis]
MWQKLSCRTLLCVSVCKRVFYDYTKSAFTTLAVLCILIHLLLFLRRCFRNDFRWNEGHTSAKCTDFWVSLNNCRSEVAFLVHIGRLQYSLFNHCFHTTFGFSMEELWFFLDCYGAVKRKSFEIPKRWF